MQALLGVMISWILLQRLHRRVLCIQLLQFASVLEGYAVHSFNYEFSFGRSNWPGGLSDLAANVYPRIRLEQHDPPVSIIPVVVCLSVLTLAVLTVIIYWIRRRRAVPNLIISVLRDEHLTMEEEEKQDVEALAAARPIIPIMPMQDVRWVPQIRSISGPAPVEGWDRKLAAPHLKRARSPPPSNITKHRNAFPDPYPKSAPAYTLSFLQNEKPHQAKSSGGNLSPPVTPHALAVSGMQARYLGRMGPDQRAEE